MANEGSRVRKKAVPAQITLDFPITYLVDLAFRDLQDLMQRPFFSLSKQKRVKPIEYESPDRSAKVTVTATPAYGMATIWDSDIIIYLVSHLNELKQKGVNDISPVIHLQPGDMLRRIGWGTGGKAYERLTAALDRLQTTSIKTNIRASNKTRETTFSWIDSWTHLVEEETNRPLGMEITISRWLFEGAIEQKNLLAIAQGYFEITSGIGKWLYRVARKHAGGNGPSGFTITLDTLHHKSGSESSVASFKNKVARIAERNDLPDVHLELLDQASKRPRLRMVMRKHITSFNDKSMPEATDDRAPSPANALGDMRMLPSEDVPGPPEDDQFVDPEMAFQLINRVTKASRLRSQDPLNPDLDQPVRAARPVPSTTRRSGPRVPDAKNVIGAKLYDQLRQECPGLDLNEIMRIFDEFLEKNPGEIPARYERRFAGFARSHYARNSEEFS